MLNKCCPVKVVILQKRCTRKEDGEAVNTPRSVGLVLYSVDQRVIASLFSPQSLFLSLTNAVRDVICNHVVGNFYFMRNRKDFPAYLRLVNEGWCLVDLINKIILPTFFADES